VAFREERNATEGVPYSAKKKGTLLGVRRMPFDGVFWGEFGGRMMGRKAE
jgi:hypothetical protein